MCDLRLICATAALALLTIAAGPATQPARPGRDLLRLLPAAAHGVDETTAKALEHGIWAHRSPRDILGRGRDVLLHLHAVDPHGNFKVERTVIQHDKAPEPPRKTTDKLDGHLDGPLLIFGDDLQKFAVVSGKELALKAVVPLGQRQWYFATLEHFNGGEIRQRVWEYLFDIQDDPLKETAGKVTLRRRLGEEMLTMECIFGVTADKEGRHLLIQWRNAEIEKLTIPPDRNYGSLDRLSTDNAILFKEEAQAE